MFVCQSANMCCFIYIGPVDFYSDIITFSRTVKDLVSAGKHCQLSHTWEPCCSGLTCDEASTGIRLHKLPILMHWTPREMQTNWATRLEIYVFGKTMNISDCPPRTHIQRFPDTFVAFRFMAKAILDNQGMIVCTPHWCSSVCVCVCVCVCAHGSRLVSTVWKVFIFRGKSSWMQIPAKSCRFILMSHWIWALKTPQSHWVFCACSLNGLYKELNCKLISHARSSFPFPIWDKILEMIPLFSQMV